jgi:LPXTG-motif cell wall-anchored protein
MSLTRKLFAAGLSAAGATAVAALALTGQPASAAPNAVHPGTVLRQEVCDAPLAGVLCDPGDNGGYGDDEGPSDGAGADDPRVHGGYGNESPAPTSPTRSPGVDNVPPGVDNVPPGGVRPDQVPPGGVSPDHVPTGVSPGTAGGDALPVTGAPVVVFGAVGAALLLAGGAALILVRRRRTA